jgi:hypothetical protein
VGRRLRERRHQRSRRQKERPRLKTAKRGC